jgi:carboxymethylenebutenolidase
MMTEQATTPFTPAQQTMIDVLERHMAAEMVTLNVDDAIATMTNDAYVNHVPVLTGGVGPQEVRHFYANHLIGQMFPPDVEIIPVSRTVGVDQIVEEGVARFTHTIVLDYLLPGVAPTNKRVELAIVVIIRFRDGKIAHEHVYWDQASVLVQLGLFDPTDLPVAGAESARKVLDPASVPSNALLHRPSYT